MEKKSAHAAEQERPDILRRRWDWFEGQPDLDPDRLVFIDETWASTKMARTHGRAPRGERLRSPIPHGHWKTTTFVVGLRNNGLVAPMVLDGPINGAAFQAYVDQVLVPELAHLAGYRWGVDRKRQLLEREGALAKFNESCTEKRAADEL